MAAPKRIARGVPYRCVKPIFAASGAAKFCSGSADAGGETKTSFLLTTLRRAGRLGTGVRLTRLAIKYLLNAPGLLSTCLACQPRRV